MIQGDRVLLRPMERDDVDAVVRMRSDPTVLAQLFGEAPPTRDGHLRWFEEMRARGDRQEFVIMDRASGHAVGTIGLSRIDPAHRRAEYGVLIGEANARDKGFAAEASRLLLGYAFGRLGLNRVYLHVFSENEAAIRLYRRVGFVPEGILRQHVYKGGRFRDVAVMGILKGGVT